MACSPMRPTWVFWNEVFHPGQFLELNKTCLVNKTPDFLRMRLWRRVSENGD